MVSSSNVEAVRQSHKTFATSLGLPNPAGASHLQHSAAQHFLSPPKTSSKPNWLTDIFSSTVAPAKTRKLIGVGGGFGLAAGLFTGGLGFNFDTLLNIGAIASLFCPALVVPVAAAYLAKGALSVVKSIGCLFSGDFGGVFSNLLNGALTAVCALPFGKLAKVKDLWNTTKSTEAFALRSINLCYGKEAAQGTYRAVNFFKGIKNNPGTAGSLASKEGATLVNRIRDGIYSLMDWFKTGKKAAKAPQLVEVATNLGTKFKGTQLPSGLIVSSAA